MPEKMSREVADGMALEDLLWAVPRLIDRTTKQLELARFLAARMPCIGSLIPGGSSRSAQDSDLPGESVDVIEVLTADTDRATSTEPATQPSTEGPTTVPSESELAVAGYDSLAASQVVPRLTTLTKSDLSGILAYEQAHRNRQTIVHRVLQLLDK